MNNIQAFFFDFDGVLADSVEVKTRAFAKLFEQYGKEVVNLVVEHHRCHGGMTRTEKFNYYYREILKTPLTDGKLAELCTRFSQLVVDDVVAAPEILGAEEFLKKWHKETLCFIISATPEDEIREIVRRRGLDPYLKEILGAPIDKESNLQALLNRYNLLPDKCIFFGDAESDYLAARACNTGFVAILPGQDAPLLKAAPEVRWYKDFAGVERCLINS